MHPFTSDPTGSVAHIGEVVLIDKISTWLGSVSPSAPHGIGDDCAVLEPIASGRQILTVDSVSYGQHFDASVSPEEAGAKLIKRNLSDIAAMGGVPGPAVLALLCSSDLSIVWLEQFFAGIRQTCERYGVSLVGGDISSLAASNFSAVLTLTGTAQTPKLRSTAIPDDHIYVTGTLGGSILGKHYTFEPRLDEGRWLAQRMHCSAQMDLTDGLAKDLKALLPVNSHAALDLDKIPIALAAKALSKQSGRSAMEHACCDGEDYELLFTMNPQVDRHSFETDWAKQFPETELTHIGVIRPSSSMGSLIDSQTNTALPWTHGFEHLKSE
ncbi:MULTISPECIES: thiamine-phosphate kinase [unclassified Lentimonas]|uniref:thiamine-phosphate kinase n=1 Tax=unclassified Lentimonas TaxID=2630993 RepID=UPI00132874D3|nr:MULTISPECIES: thiamine-phosphate kinase [unclassified Lentimonas]CAA6678307.1 Thiamine-monophosphate kinase (EC [Lentimonas sp. CC4]CAA6685399.1 Thiamine-monophosphate kinase (EC [Lentimonas sp. CC6]CAA7076848.1 Thiamine-monophosphate kinase (EC [Lentimonas sp. CC4]CAA7170754.1 Thiamine-monophosphate kinase (EC [Lentimonas sp. CC21]CAA7179684.1 Thiamine-monophosphate kinase (EC [Lentimonas sp. CC8]